MKTLVITLALLTLTACASKSQQEGWKAYAADRCVGLKAQDTEYQKCLVEQYNRCENDWELFGPIGTRCHIAK